LRLTLLKDIVEGKILITGVKKKIDRLELKALGMYLPSTSKKSVDVVPQLTRLNRENFFEHTEEVISNLNTNGAIKRDFSFKLKPSKGNSKLKVLPETYYGFMYAIKYVIYANVTVDSTHEGTAKIEIQLRNYVS
jgi:hypothetical protein